MRALRAFITHKGGETRRFERGEKIPLEWVESIGNQRLVDAPLEHLQTEGEEGDKVVSLDATQADRWPTFRELSTVDEVLAWIGSADDFDERIARASHAQKVEKAGRGRVTLISGAQEFLDLV